MLLEAVFVCEKLSKLQQPGGILAPGHGHHSQPSVEVFSPPLDLHTGCP